MFGISLPGVTRRRESFCPGPRPMRPLAHVLAAILLLPLFHVAGSQAGGSLSAVGEKAAEMWTLVGGTAEDPEDKFLMVAFGNRDFVPFFHSWLCNTAGMEGVHERTLLVFTDKAGHDAMVESSSWSKAQVAYAEFDERLQDDLAYYSVGFGLLMLHRNKVVHSLLRDGIDVLMFEPDAAWASNPMEDPHLARSGADITGFLNKDAIGMGFTLLRSRPVVLGLWAELNARHSAQFVRRNASENLLGGLANGTYTDEMDLFRELVGEYSNVSVSLLPWCLYPDGRWYDGGLEGDGSVLRWGCRDRGLEPVVIQNNFIVGMEAKMGRAKRWNHWFLEQQPGGCVGGEERARRVEAILTTQILSVKPPPPDECPLCSTFAETPEIKKSQYYHQCVESSTIGWKGQAAGERAPLRIQVVFPPLVQSKKKGQGGASRLCFMDKQDGDVIDLVVNIHGYDPGDGGADWERLLLVVFVQGSQLSLLREVPGQDGSAEPQRFVRVWGPRMHVQVLKVHGQQASFGALDVQVQVLSSHGLFRTVGLDGNEDDPHTSDVLLRGGWGDAVASSLGTQVEFYQDGGDIPNCRLWGRQRTMLPICRPVVSQASWSPGALDATSAASVAAEIKLPLNNQQVALGDEFFLVHRQIKVPPDVRGPDDGSCLTWVYVNREPIFESATCLNVPADTWEMVPLHTWIMEAGWYEVCVQIGDSSAGSMLSRTCTVFQVVNKQPDGVMAAEGHRSMISSCEALSDAEAGQECAPDTYGPNCEHNIRTQTKYLPPEDPRVFSGRCAVSNSWSKTASEASSLVERHMREAAAHSALACESPSDNPRFFVHENHYHESQGFGAQMFSVMNGLSYAVNHDKLMVLAPDSPNIERHNLRCTHHPPWQCYLRGIATCSSNQTREWPDEQRVAAIDCLPPPSISRGDRFVWQMTVASALLQPNVIGRTVLSQVKQNIDWRLPVVAVHIRRGDSCFEPSGNSYFRECIPISSFADAVVSLRALYGVQQAFVASDDPRVFKRMRELLSPHSVRVMSLQLTADHAVAYNSGDDSIQSHDVANLGIVKGKGEATFADLFLLVECDYFVGTFSSQMSRLAFLLTCAAKGYLVPYVSLDVPFFVNDDLDNFSRAYKGNVRPAMHLLESYGWDIDRLNRLGQGHNQEHSPIGGCVEASPPPPGCSCSAEPALRVIVLAHTRPASLMRLLASLDEAEYEGDCVHLDVWIDPVRDGELAFAADPGVLSVATDTAWRHGGKTVHVWRENGGLARQWIQTWGASVAGGLRGDASEIGLILEDDLEVSPLFWKWLKRAHAAYGRRPDVAGFTLQRAQLCAGQCDDLQGGPDGVSTNFLYELVGTWGYSPTAAHWARFEPWARNFTASGERPYVQAVHPGTGAVMDVSPTVWYKDFEAAGRCPGRECMWSMLHIKYTSAHPDKHTVYVKCPGETTMATNHREPGLHHESHGGEDYPPLEGQQGLDAVLDFPEDPWVLDYFGLRKARPGS